MGNPDVGERPPPGADALGDSAAEIARLRAENELLRAERATLAGQRGAALENARLYEEAERRRREEAAFNAIAGDLAASLEGGTLLQHIVDHALALLAADFAEILLYEPAAGELRSAAVSGAAAGPLLDRTLQPGIGLGGHVWQSGRPVTVDDYHADPRIVHTEAIDRLVRRVGIAAGVGVPITLGEERLGVVVVGDDTPRRFSEHDEALLGRLATQAALAVRNARLYDEVQRRAARVETLNEIGRD